MNRRQFLGTAAVCLATPQLARPKSQPPRTRLILLGTAGGPRPRITRSATAQAVVVGDTAYVVDCGDGVARQLVLAGIPLRAVRHIFITHHHSDHNADYGNLIVLAWAAGLRTRVDSWGPPPLARMTDQAFQMNAADIEARTADEGPRDVGALTPRSRRGSGHHRRDVDQRGAPPLRRPHRRRERSDGAVAPCHRLD